jgi:hypothetical protein
VAPVRRSDLTLVARTIDRVKAGPIVLVILSLVAAVVGYAAAVAVLSALPLPKGLADLLTLFVPVFIAGLCMVPFVAPLLDRMAKRDLEAHRAESAAAEQAPRDPDTPAN